MKPIFSGATSTTVPATMKESRIFTFALALVLSLSTIQSTTAGSFVPTNALSVARESHTATLLSNGKVLVAGGFNYPGSLVLPSSTEVYDPSVGNWVQTGSLNDGRTYHTATLLQNGQVLAAGGQDSQGVTNTAELYDPSTGTWTATGSLGSVRQYHTATLLANGKVLVTGGEDNTGPIKSAELYDPVLGTWSATGDMSTAREYHTATLLPDGKVLVSGGSSGSASLATAEVYDPATGLWSLTGTMNSLRQDHTATLLSNGKVLVAGGDYISGGFHVSPSSELYDPGSGTWTLTGAMATARHSHTSTLLTNGKVLVTGGANFSGLLATAEAYDPTAGTWSPTGPMSYVRENHTATLMTDGKVVLVGGAAAGSFNNSETASVELYDDSATPSWTVTDEMVAVSSSGHQSVLLGNGKVLVAGGTTPFSNPLSAAELYDPGTGTWTATGSMSNSRALGFTATLLNNGKVLVAGGYQNDVGTVFSSSELFDPATGTWTTTGAMHEPRATHTATLLPNGKVLVAGGYKDNGNTILATAELYDPVTGTWTTTGSLAGQRENHSAILLPNGKVLVAGGVDQIDLLTRVELYDPAAGTWTSTGSLNPAREVYMLTLLPNGKVMAIGGNGPNQTTLTNVDLYDAATQTWSPAAGLNIPRWGHTATLLPSGRVLVTGGEGSPNGVNASVELYDPVTAKWTFTDGMHGRRASHTATLLPNGKVLIAGAILPQSSLDVSPTAELYTSPNSSPSVANNIPDQSNTYGVAFNYTFPANTFTDPDAGQSLTYAAFNLPPGILFNGPTKTFSGTNTSAGNYSVSVTATDNGTPPLSTNTAFTFAVNKAALLAQARNHTNTYGDFIFVNSYVDVDYSGFKLADNLYSLQTVPAISTTATSTSSVGLYPIHLTGGNDTRYSFVLQDGTLTLVPAPLTVVVYNACWLPGQTNPPLSGRLVGLLNSDPITASFSTAATPASPPGSYPISVTFTDPNNRLPNYSVSYLQGELTVLPYDFLFEVIHPFGTNGLDTGSNPNATVTEVNGVLYGLSGGGALGRGALFGLNKNGTGYHLLTSFPTFYDLSDNSSGPGPLVRGTNGLLYGVSPGNSSFVPGAIFSVDTNGFSITALHQFSLSEGITPNGPLLLSTNGLLYGTAWNGNNLIYRIAQNGSGYTILWQNSVFGTGPWQIGAGLIEGSDGFLYGTSTGGGDHTAGTVFKIQKDGSGLTVLRSFSDGGDPAANLIEGSDGWLYGTTLSGGMFNQGSVFKLAKDGSGFSLVHQFDGVGGDGTAPYGSLIEASDGYLYGATRDGGSSAGTWGGTVYRLRKDGTGYCILHNFGGPSSEPGYLTSSLIQGSDGAFYGTAQYGVVNNKGAVFRIIPLAPPTMNITPGAGAVTISWAPSTPGFVLQQNDSLNPFTWSNAPSGSTNPVTLPVGSSARFFRLHKP
jgi:uncharacterized repeat protein (TIGR03803 family)